MSGKDVMSPFRQRAARLLLATASAATCLSLPSVAAAQARSAAVTEIRFDVIDPPVVLQVDITSSHPTSNNSKIEQPLECAAMFFVGGRLLIASDRHEHCIFAAPVDLKAMKIDPPRPFVIVPNEQYLIQDAEAMTVLPQADGSFTAFVMSSLSNHRSEQPLPMRRHLGRFTFPDGDRFAPNRATVIDGTPIRETLSAYFDKLGITPYRTYFDQATTEDKNTYRWANVEGMAFTADGKTLICGMRNPLTKGNTGNALMFSIKNIDEAFDSGDAHQARVSDLFTLDLGDRGVSDMCWDPLTKGFLIAGAKSNGPKLGKDQPFPPNTLDSALFWWSGRKSEKPILFATVPEMKIEAICRMGTSRFIAIGSDEGDESEGRSQKQSVITVMDFTGFGK